jgi:hypothetical protein
MPLETNSSELHKKNLAIMTESTCCIKAEVLLNWERFVLVELSERKMQLSLHANGPTEEQHMILPVESPALQAQYSMYFTLLSSYYLFGIVGS